jgi:hypothetical protein
VGHRCLGLLGRCGAVGQYIGSGSGLLQLRSQVAGMAEDSVRLRRENELLLQRFIMAEQATGEVTRRVGALEVSLPEMLERLPTATHIDPSTTASTGARQDIFEAEGGSVSVVHRPLEPAVMPPLPQVTDSAELAPVPDRDAFGVALGFPVDPDEAEAAWQAMAANIGTLLIGLAPLLADVDGSDSKQLVVGPLLTRSQAAALCVRTDRVGIPCEPVPFTGQPLPLLN